MTGLNGQPSAIPFSNSQNRPPHSTVRFKYWRMREPSKALWRVAPFLRSSGHGHSNRL